MVSFLFEALIPSMKMIEFGAHMHVLPHKVDQIFHPHIVQVVEGLMAQLEVLGGVQWQKIKLGWKHGYRKHYFLVA